MRESIWVKCAQKNDHSARLQQDLRVHPSSGSNIHRCALWTGKWQGGKTTTRTAIGMNTRIYNEKSPKMSHIKYPLLISGCLTPTRERLQSKRRFLKLWHHLTCLDVATKYYSHFSSIAWARKNYSEVCCTQGRHSPFSSAFYASIILHRAK